MIKICAWCNRLEGITLKGRGITDVMCMDCKNHYWKLAIGDPTQRVILPREMILIFFGVLISDLYSLTRKVIFKLKLAREHYLNDLHLMCRVMDLGVSRNRAIKICKVLTYKLY